MSGQTRRFACTACGACCDRPPELELGESTAHAGHFVLQLMLRPYLQPRKLEDWRRTVGAGKDGAAQQAWLAQKRLLAAQAVLSFDSRGTWQGRALECTTYVTASALALDLTPGRCHQRDGALCAIHAERPLSCRTVPFHYSRAEPLDPGELDAFVATPGYRCQNDGDAPVVLEEGRVTEPGYAADRAIAAKRMEADKPWREAIAAAIAAGDASLPSRAEIMANAARGASAVPIASAWQVAANAGAADRDSIGRAAALQLALIQAEISGLLERGGQTALVDELRQLAQSLSASLN